MKRVRRQIEQDTCCFQVKCLAERSSGYWNNRIVMFSSDTFRNDVGGGETSTGVEIKRIFQIKWTGIQDNKFPTNVELFNFGENGSSSTL